MTRFIFKLTEYALTIRKSLRILGLLPQTLRSNSRCMLVSRKTSFQRCGRELLAVIAHWTSQENQLSSEVTEETKQPLEQLAV